MIGVSLSLRGARPMSIGSSASWQDSLGAEGTILSDSGSGMVNPMPHSGQIPRSPAKCVLRLSLCPLGQ